MLASSYTLVEAISLVEVDVKEILMQFWVFHFLEAVQ